MLKKNGGQTVIELILILPVFMLIIFVVLELGNIAYHTLIAHHISYELARVGSMVGVKKHSGAADGTRMNSKMRAALSKMLGMADPGKKVRFTPRIVRTSTDPQLRIHTNEDLVVNVVYRVDLAFPLTSYIFASEPKKLGILWLKAYSKMPIEKPLID